MADEPTRVRIDPAVYEERMSRARLLNAARRELEALAAGPWLTFASAEELIAYSEARGAAKKAKDGT